MTDRPLWCQHGVNPDDCHQCNLIYFPPPLVEKKPESELSEQAGIVLNRDTEINALRMIQEALEPLPADAQVRIIAWTSRRYLTAETIRKTRAMQFMGKNQPRGEQ